MPEITSPARTPAYQIEPRDPACDHYETLIGPDGFSVTLTEPEDRVWRRDLSDVIVRLNAQHAEIELLKRRMDNATHQMQRAAALFRAVNAALPELKSTA